VTTKEAGFVEDALKEEALELVKLETYEQQVEDPELRHLLHQAASCCRRHIDELLGALR